jgi:hypothetical protein
MRDAERRSALVVRSCALCSDAVLSVGIVGISRFQPQRESWASGIPRSLEFVSGKEIGF